MSRQQYLHQFRSLHQQSTPFLLGNVWDAYTARLAEQAGYKALGSSSHAIAFTLGYEDGENISFKELFFVVKRILASVSIPVSVDFEAGYSEDPSEVAAYVKQLADAGVAGINLEDGIVKDGERVLESADQLADKIRAIKSVTDIFINARTDTYTTRVSDPLETSVERALKYQEAGANGIFVPLIEHTSDIQAFTEKVTIPLNVFVTTSLPDFETLGNLGVKRISHGAKQYEQLMKKSEYIFKDFFRNKNYSTILGS